MITLVHIKVSVQQRAGEWVYKFILIAALSLPASVVFGKHAHNESLLPT